MKNVYFINNEGGGFAEKLVIEDDVKLREVFDEFVGGDPKNYLIRVNRTIAAEDQILNDGDRITITPQKIAGA